MPNLASITNELKGASLFFTPEPGKNVANTAPPVALEPMLAAGDVPKMAKMAQGPQRPSGDDTSPDGHSPLSEPAAAKQPKPRDLSDDRSADKRTPYPAGEQVVMPARKQESVQPIMQASTLETIRRAVRDPGDKTTYVRLTQAEKIRLVDLVYRYRRRGTNTSENELVRIAIGLLLEDYEERGEDSLLAQVLEALHA